MAGAETCRTASLQWSRALSKLDDLSPLECDSAFTTSLLLLPFRDTLCTAHVSQMIKVKIKNRTNLSMSLPLLSGGGGGGASSSPS